MYLHRTLNSGLLTNKLFYNKFYLRYYAKNKNPFVKTWEIMSKEIPAFFTNKKPTTYPENVDVVVIGGGFIGSSVAYWLKSRAGEGLSVVVLDKDLRFKGLQTGSSLGTLTQHFSLPENMYLSQHSAEFLRNIREHLGSNVDLQFQPHNNLILACEKYAEKLEQNVALLAEYGLHYKLISVEDLKFRYPWLNTQDIKMGCLGIESEGTFNAQEFLKGLIIKAQELGSVYVNAEVIGFELEKQRDVLIEGVYPGSFERINKVIYKTPDNEEHCIKFAACVLAAGDNSGNIARLAKVGTSDGLLSIPLPIEKREYNVYSIKDKAKDIGLNIPIVTDTSGLWIQRNGLDSNLLCGHVPLISEETKDLTCEEYYTAVIKPPLINRIQNCENAEITLLTTEKQDTNTYDYNGIIGPHPYHNNLFIAAGFGKQGCQHAPGIGRAISELIIDSQYSKIDLSRFCFDRIIMNEPLVEFNIY